MNILMVTPYFYEPPGGKYGVMRLSIELNKHGHNVYVISSKVRNAKAYEEFEGVKVFRKKPLFYMPSLPYAATFVTSDIFRYIKSFNIDVLHVHTIHYFSSLSAAIVSKMINFPYILSILGMTTTFAQEFVDLIFKIYESTISKFVIAQASLIVAIAKQLVSRALHLGASPTKIRVIPHGIDPNIYSPNNLGSNIRARFGIEEDDKVIGFVGRLVPLKGIKYLLEALKIINKKMDKVKVLIVGDGPQRRELEILINKNLKRNVIFTGFISKEDLPNIYPALDIFTLPSLTEGLSNTLLEAMACGKPVITTSVGGNSELVDNGKNGYLIQPKSSKELAERIVDLLHDPNKRIQMGRRGRDTILRRYTWEKIIPIYEDAYEQILCRSI
jgi:glycosyltransferase involved in cell wall biosynthesis